MAHGVSGRVCEIVFALSLVLSLAHGAMAANGSESRPPGWEYLRVTPSIGDLQAFPPDNWWNVDISRFPVHPNSDAFIKGIGEGADLHPDFGTVWQGGPSGIPFAVVHADQPKLPMPFENPEEADQGLYPIPDDAPVECEPHLTGDRHLLVVDVDNKMLYELYRAFKTETGWRAKSGAIWDLTSNKYRPLGWTSADGAGLAIFPGLVRYDEVVGKKEINHALGFTVHQSQFGYILPATHWCADPDSAGNWDLPPMGLRVRLKADYDISPFPPELQVILKALKKYGMIVADEGGDWYITGVPDPRWDVDVLGLLHQVKGRDFEAVYTGPTVRRETRR
jgi:hypothetical protein